MRAVMLIKGTSNDSMTVSKILDGDQAVQVQTPVLGSVWTRAVRKRNLSGGHMPLAVCELLRVSVG